MKLPLRLIIAIFLFIQVSQAHSEGTNISFSGSLVSHPVVSPVNSRSAAVWKTQVGAWGENFAENILRIRGFDEIHEIKTGSNAGIDRVAIKRGPNGSIIDVKFVEVKTTRTNFPKLGHTKKAGKQMSRSWLAMHLAGMRRSDDPKIRQLALEISRFRRKSGVSVESLGEVIHINTKAGTVTGYFWDGKSVRYSERIEDLLKKIEVNSIVESTRKWAVSHLAFWDQISSHSQSSWLMESISPKQKSLLVPSGNRLVGLRNLLAKHSRRIFSSRILARAAGPLAVLATTALDAKEFYDTEISYRRHEISVRQRNISHSSSIGGFAGAIAGASAGVWSGASVGTLGGPYVAVTVPLFTFIGGSVGAIGGYIGGSTIAGYVANKWYDSIDSKIRDRFEVEFLTTRFQQ